VAQDSVGETGSHCDPSGAPDPVGCPADVYVPEIDDRYDRYDRYDRSTHSGYQFAATYREVVSRWGLGDRAG